MSNTAAEIVSQLTAQPDFAWEGFDIEEWVDALPIGLVDRLLDPILEELTRAKFFRFENLFPDEGPYRRELYAKHMEFFRAGGKYRERLFMAANRVGKTVSGAYESTAHLTGRYPNWWEGKKFRGRIRAWAAGDTNETTRDIIQLELLGTVIGIEGGRKGFDGSGMIPRDCIGGITWKQGVQNLADQVLVKHKSGNWSSLAFKSFDQGRRAFQGTNKELIWLDEECPADVRDECLIRLTTTRGILIETYTPLRGMTENTMAYMHDDVVPTVLG